MYTVDYFIKKFEAIPEKNWGTGSIINHCAYYHCDDDISYDGCGAKALTKIFSALYHSVIPELNVIKINDGNNLNYQQPTPKQRILAALYDIKKMQEGKTEYPDITKELAVLPVNETTDIKTVLV